MTGLTEWLGPVRIVTGPTGAACVGVDSDDTIMTGLAAVARAGAAIVTGPAALARAGAAIMVG